MDTNHITMIVRHNISIISSIIALITIALFVANNSKDHYRIFLIYKI